MFPKKSFPVSSAPNTRRPFLCAAVLLLAVAILFAQAPQAQAGNYGECCSNGRKFELFLTYTSVGGMICNWKVELEENFGTYGKMIWGRGPTSSCTPYSESVVFDGEITASVAPYLQSIQVTGCSSPSNWGGAGSCR